MGHCQTITRPETDLGVGSGIRSFTRIELIDIWRNLENSSSSGILMFMSEDDKKAFFVQNGRIIHAHSSTPGEKFKDFLLTGTDMTTQELERITKEKPDNIHLGAVLLERELVYPLAMRDILRQMITSIASSIFMWERGEFYFSPDVYNPIIEEHASVPVGAIILEGIRRLGQDAPWIEIASAQRGWLKPVRGRNLVDLCFQLTDEEEIYLNRVKREVPVQEFIRANKEGEDRALLLLTGLVMTGYMDVNIDGEEKQEDLTGAEDAQVMLEDSDDGRCQVEAYNFGKTPAPSGSSDQSLAGDITYGELLDAFRGNCTPVYRNIPEDSRPIWDRKKDAVQPECAVMEPNAEPESDSADFKEYKVPPVIAQQSRKGYWGTVVTKTVKQGGFVPLPHAATPHEQLDTRKDTGRSTQSHLREGVKNKKADELFKKGLRQYREGKYFNVVKLLEDAIKLAPDKGKYYNLLGLTQSKNNHITWQKRAESSFKKAIECDPWQPEYFVNLANLYQKQGMSSRAIKQYKLALMLDPRNRFAMQELDKLIVGA
ncbi:DUF4388 domain-containing protein [Acidobacteriota bacterium]